MPMLRRARLRIDFSFAPENVLALDRGAIGVDAAVNDSAAAYHSVINQNETPQLRNAIMVIQDNRRPCLNGEAPDLVPSQLIGFGRASFQRRRIHHFLD